MGIYGWQMFGRFRIQMWMHPNQKSDGCGMLTSDGCIGMQMQILWWADGQKFEKGKKQWCSICASPMVARVCSIHIRSNVYG
jgi:hypothetical protein